MEWKLHCRIKDQSYETIITIQNNVRIAFVSEPYLLSLVLVSSYHQSAPPQISARGRTDDLAAILSVIDDAKKFVFISVMDFLPANQYSKPLR